MLIATARAGATHVVLFGPIRIEQTTDQRSSEFKKCAKQIQYSGLGFDHDALPPARWPLTGLVPCFEARSAQV